MKHHGVGMTTETLYCLPADAIQETSDVTVVTYPRNVQTRALASDFGPTCELGREGWRTSRSSSLII
jgi:hypothetical protein